MVSPTFFGKPYGFKNSFFIWQEDIPFNEIDPVLTGQSTMKVKVIFKMAKEAFDAIGCMWYFRIAQVVEHIR